MNTLAELKTAKASDGAGFFFRGAVARYRETGWSEGGPRRAVNPILVDNIAFLFDCKPVRRASDWMEDASSVCFGGLELVCRCLLWVLFVITFSSFFASGELRFVTVAFPR